MKKALTAVGAIIFLSTAGLGLYLLNRQMIAGSEFVALMIAFAVIGLLVSFAAEVQEFSIAGNLVKLREVRNDVVASVNLLKVTQIEILRLMLHAKPFINAHLPWTKGLSAIESDFWRIVHEAERIGATSILKNDFIEVIDLMLQTLYLSTTMWGGPARKGLESHSSFSEISAELLDPNILLGSANSRGDGDVEKYKKFVLGRLEDMSELYGLRKKISCV
jgi:hypothetical protein